MFLKLKPKTSSFIERMKQDFDLSIYKNLFNVSICLLPSNNGYVAAIRALDYTGKLPFRSYLLVKNGDGKESVDLSNHFSQQDIGIVADPKLFETDNEIWCAFNTGHTSDGLNNIYLFKVFPQISEPLKCLYDGRQQIEKNWAFFRRNGTWFALYGLSPVTVLKAKETNITGVLEFGLESKESKLQFQNFSIGTQFCLINGRLFFVCHKKILLGKKRFYLGKLFSFDIEHMEVKKVTKKYLIHSLLSLFGEKKKWNKNLISCTYFSGITYDKSTCKIILGYGINDLHYNIAEIGDNVL